MESCGEGMIHAPARRESRAIFDIAQIAGKYHRTYHTERACDRGFASFFHVGYNMEDIMENVEYRYVEVFRINLAYIIELGDSGLHARICEDGTVENEDLRLHIELSGGHKLLLMDSQRFYTKGNNLIIEDLKEV